MNAWTLTRRNSLAPLVASRNRLLKSTTPASFLMIACVAAGARKTIVEWNQTLAAAGNPYDGVEVRNGARLDGADLDIRHIVTGATSHGLAIHFDRQPDMDFP